MFVFIFIPIILIIFATISEINAGNIDYIVFCALFISGIFIFVFALDSMAEFIQTLLMRAGIYISRETTDKIATFIILIWLIATYVFYKKQKSKK